LNRIKNHASLLCHTCPQTCKHFNEEERMLQTFKPSSLEIHMKIPFLSRLLASNAARKANTNEGMGATILPAAEGNTTLGIPGTEADAEVVRVLRFQRFPLKQTKSMETTQQLQRFPSQLPTWHRSHPQTPVNGHGHRSHEYWACRSPGFERMYKNM